MGDSYRREREREGLLHRHGVGPTACPSAELLVQHEGTTFKTGSEVNGGCATLPQLWRGTRKVHPPPAKLCLPSQLSWQGIMARTLRQAKSRTETLASLPAPCAPIQQVQRSRKPPGNDGNGSLANALGCCWCQTIPLPEESGAKATRVKSSSSRSRLLHGQRGKTQELCAGSEQGMQRWHCHPEPLQPAKVSARSIARRRVQGISSIEPCPGLAQPNPPSANPPADSTSIPTHCVVPQRHTRGRRRKSPSV